MKKNIIFITLLLIAFALGFFLGGGGPETSNSTATHDHEKTKATSQVWTCSMHPQIRMPQSGQCPICGMDLIPASMSDDSGDLGERELKLSPVALKLAEIQTVKVERTFVPVKIRMVGKVDYNETAVKNIAAWIPGRIDRLFVDYTGISVKKGDHLVSLYSPELLTAQEELLQAVRSAREFRSSSMKIMRETALQTLDASREKLRLWGLTQAQISGIKKKGKAVDHMTIYSPMSGIVIHKNVEEGAYVKTGTSLYTIADMSRLWIKLDAYESDLVWLRYGQEVNIETEAYPGEIFKGTIAFIDPVLNPKTRTVKVRVNVSNKDGTLKPGMFVRTTIDARVAQSGKVMDEALAGKWICPMHPEVIKGNKGSCDICGMPLVRTESLGYAVNTEDQHAIAPLVIPASAPLITGKRAVVYVAHPSKKAVFEGREITLGPRVGYYYIVSKGLDDGETVVTNGNFKIDSALQIQAKPSMMSPEGGVAPAGHAHHGGTTIPEKETGPVIKHEGDHDINKSGKTGDKKIAAPKAFREQIDGVLAVYFMIQTALSRDDMKLVQKQSDSLLQALESVDMGLLGGPGHMIWMKDLGVLVKQGNAMKSASNITEQRESFHLLSENLKSVVKRFGTGGNHSVLQFHCPMAFGGKGADWLQDNKDLKNPYFGQKMLQCGEQTDTLVTTEN